MNQKQGLVGGGNLLGRGMDVFWKTKMLFYKKQPYIKVGILPLVIIIIIKTQVY